MRVQIPWRLLILIGTPVRLMANVGNCGVMRCFAVWLIGPLNLNGLVVVDSDYSHTLHSIRSTSHRHSLSADPTIGQRRVWHRLVLFGGLPEEMSVRSRAETRASIAQNLEGGNEGARDRVVTELHLGLL